VGNQCAQTITPDIDNKAHLFIKALTYAIKFDTHLCRFDYLMITSINTEKNLNLGKHCGKKSGQTALVTGDFAVLRFRTDEIDERKGFFLLFTAIPEGSLIKTTRITHHNQLLLT